MLDVGLFQTPALIRVFVLLIILYLGIPKFIPEPEDKDPIFNSGKRAVVLVQVVAGGNPIAIIEDILYRQRNAARFVPERFSKGKAQFAIGFNSGVTHDTGRKMGIGKVCK